MEPVSQIGFGLPSGARVCPKCGASIFHAAPGKTTEDDIVAFVQSTTWDAAAK